MKTLYLDCGMGAAGDMLTAALLELLPNPAAFLDVLSDLGLPGVTFEAERAEKCGIRGTHMSVRIHGAEEDEHEHRHSGMADIAQIVSAMPVSERIRADILSVYAIIAEAESHVHGVPVSEIHFHEVGAMDAIADIAAVCLLMERIAPDRVIASTVHVGSGQVRCAHGILPVPAPATARILRDVPIRGGDIEGELCTPTGAALLKYFVDAFAPMPEMKIHAIGYGMGKKDFPRANCVRAMLGEAADDADIAVELRCNLDDMTAEAIAFAEAQLFAAGALDVYTVPVQMKKSRPGCLLCVLCRDADQDRMVRLIFKHTTTLGVRALRCRRHVLSRTTQDVQTQYGEVRKKVSRGYGVVREKYEFEDIARIARAQDMSLADVMNALPKQDA